MTEAETARFILGLRGAGWNAEEILNFILYIASGEEQYKPGRDDGKKNRKPRRDGIQRRDGTQIGIIRC